MSFSLSFEFFLLKIQINQKVDPNLKSYSKGKFLFVKSKVISF